MTKLQLKFDPNQDYQLEAIKSITGLFEGLPPTYSREAALGAEIVSNLPPYQGLTEDWLFDNLRATQDDFNEQAEQRKDEFGKINVADTDLEMDDGIMLQGITVDSTRFPHFTVEMETGTGKTYVYLRAIHELRKQYGFRKFIIVVPSRAIYEGVIKSFNITRSHFQGLYGNESVNIYRYDGAQISRVRIFATSTATDIMVMTLDSFNKKTNRFYRATEKLPGERKPYQYIQETRPIVILDEPQNMESEKSQEAIRTLNPLFTLRFSATHRSTPNLTYRLTPFEACRQGLVKKIAVYGVTEQDDLNQPFLNLKAIERLSGSLVATVSTYLSKGGQTRTAEITLKHKDNLHAKTNRDEHQGYVVEDINLGGGFVRFTNGLILHLKETIGRSRVEIFREQIKQTIKRHMEQQQRLYPKHLKVLSLFFIDRVANYTSTDKPLIKNLFDEEFNKLKRAYPLFKDREPQEVREGYFASMKVQGEEVYVDTLVDDVKKRKKDKDAEKAAYELIMKRKERLLSFEEPVSFIFAHSALKEGWDNPNVFQICTLNQTVSPIRKRQEIGRGLRLCVDQSGERNFDEEVNVLTVIANESYQTYAENLQQEYVEDGHAPPPHPSNAQDEMVTRNELIFTSNEFESFWRNLMQRTTYHIHIDTPTLIEECVRRINAASIPVPVLVVDKGKFIQTEFALKLETVSEGRAKLFIRIATTDDTSQEFRNTFKRNNDLAKIFSDNRLRGYKITAINPDPETPSVTFANKQELTIAEPIIFQSEAGQSIRQTRMRQEKVNYPVFNLLDRTAKETGATRPTINQIFKRLSNKKKAQILNNPEGFSNVFITEVRNALADHIARNIEFTLTGDSSDYDLEDLFPISKEFPQKELIEAGDNSIYNQVQKDSGEEENFVNWRLKDKEEILFYLKFPPRFKINFPKIIGNYNPDWGIVRRDKGNTFTLELVRETKGSLDIDQLQFPHEARKIRCARQHFKAIGIDYRPITARVKNWWEPEGSEVSQEEFDF